MSQYWVDWATDIGIVLVVCVVVAGGSLCIWRLWTWVKEDWDKGWSGDE
jgi:hypothetical protein